MVRPYLFCMKVESFSEAIGGYFFLYFLQLIYTCIVWGTFLNRHLINSVLIGVLFTGAFISTGVFCRFYVKRDDDDREAKFRKKLIPIAFFVQVLYSIMPCFSAIIMFIDDPAEGLGAVFVFLISLVFTVFWFQGFHLVSQEVRELINN